ncbi:hypothetical protein ACHHYP_05534 [Achlya hypogyna]|uniref:Transmembrane protein n=1 Tax=Achlya hypogyna TaxID=1202772 RepID=A0A1V9YXM0_ACHHY|nr:hypothetical protein ACHHYP_05534 [Achlya hypogyna]
MQRNESRGRPWASCALGYLYVLTSLLWSIYSLVLFWPSAENDLFWPNFYSHGTYSLLQRILNLQLTLLYSDAPTTVDLLAPAADASVFDPIVGVPSVYPRFVVYHKLTSVSVAITGLRAMDPGFVTAMITPYCWVDLAQRWALAHTAKRLERCRKHDVDNGAVYLEAVLRNIDMTQWLAQNTNNFYDKIAAGVAELGGDAWVAAIVSHRIEPFSNEVALWRTAGLLRFQLQWANRIQIGIDDQISITTAFGNLAGYSIKAIPVVNLGASWCSSYMYMALFNDFNALSNNQSLVMNTSNWIGANDNRQLENFDVSLPLNQVYTLFHDTVGALDDIDLRWISIPPTLSDTVATFRAAVLTRLRYGDTAFFSALSRIETISVPTVPQKWQDASLRFLGGNPMCSYGASLPFVQRSFGFDDACGTQVAMADMWSPFSGLFALTMVQGATNRICANVPSMPALCNDLVTATAAAHALLNLSLPAPPLTDLGLSKMQFVLDPFTGLRIETMSLLDESFAFFGWLNIYDWALFQREAVVFEGDKRAFPLMSYYYEPLAPPTPVHNDHRGVAQYHLYAACLVTVVLCLVALLATAIWVTNRSCRPQWHLFSRVASAVWLNRGVLFLRSLFATLMLATATVSPVTTHTGQNLVRAYNSLLTSFVLASETTWFSYVCHDFLHPLTGVHTRVYAPRSTLLSWGAVALIDILAPVEMLVELDQQCLMLNMDYQVYCTSATVMIGAMSRPPSHSQNSFSHPCYLWHRFFFTHLSSHLLKKTN